MLSSPHMIEAAIMHQIVQEAVMGIGDILNAVAARTAGGYVPRADRPDLLVGDPAVAPLFRQATSLAAELGITLPRVAMMPSAGLLELVSARAWSRAVNPNPLLDTAPLDWLMSAGYDATRTFLTDLAAAQGSGSLRLLVVGGAYRTTCCAAAPSHSRGSTTRCPPAAAARRPRPARRP
jgi:hypothetical protein